MPTRPKKALRYSGDGGMPIKDIGAERLRSGVVSTSSLVPPPPGGGPAPSGSPTSLYSGGTPAQIDVGDAAGAGSGAGFARGDHQHGLPAPGVPTDSDFGDVADDGVSTKVAREDHLHGRESAPATPDPSDTVEDETTFGISADAGASSDYSRADHTHGSTPEEVLEWPEIPGPNIKDNIQFNRSLAQQVPDVGAATRSSYGMGTPGANNGTIASGDDADGPWQLLTTGATDGNDATIVTRTIYRRDWGSMAFGTLKLPSALSEVRFSMGFTSAASWNADCPTTNVVALFDYDTDQDGTAFWRAVTHDAVTTTGAVGACTRTATSVAVAVDTIYRWAIRLLDSSVEFYIASGDNPLALVATLTTKLPVATTLMLVYTRVLTNDNSAKDMRWGRHTIVTKP